MGVRGIGGEWILAIHRETDALLCWSLLCNPDQPFPPKNAKTNIKSLKEDKIRRNIHGFPKESVLVTVVPE